MGCDIHMTTEVKHEGKWVCVDTISGHHMRWADEEKPFQYSCAIAEERNYRRFAALAGVRGDGPAPKGIPKDVSETTKFHIDRWGVDGHSHSYLNLKDAARIYLMTSGITDPSAWPAMYPASYFFDYTFGDEYDHETEVRVVFWFDN